MNDGDNSLLQPNKAVKPKLPVENNINERGKHKNDKKNSKADDAVDKKSTIAKTLCLVFRLNQ